MKMIRGDVNVMRDKQVRKDALSHSKRTDDTAVTKRRKERK